SAGRLTVTGWWPEREAPGARRGVVPMSLHRSSGFRPIGEILARQVLPGLCSALRYPLRVSCLGTVSFVDDHDTRQFDRTIVLGECTTPEDAMTIAAQRVSRDDI